MRLKLAPVSVALCLNFPTAFGEFEVRRQFFGTEHSNINFSTFKEYFTKVVGPIKRCVITYGPNGQSRGIATVEFSRASDAATAVQKYNGVEVDKRPMKVELVVDPTAPASFADRIGYAQYPSEKIPEKSH